MRRLPSSAPPTANIDFEGKSIPVVEGEPLACSLLASQEDILSRSVKYHRPRGPYCFAAACSNCLVRVDGVPNVFACQTRAKDGMKVERQNAFPSANIDVFSLTDWMFPKGMDHHEMFAGVPVAEQVMLKITRQLAGLGKLPDANGMHFPAPMRIQTSTCIIGAGPAGLGAAQTLQNESADFVLLERQPFLGGRWATGIPAAGDPPLTAFSFPSAWLNTHALGFYEDAHGLFLAAIKEKGIVRIDAQSWVLTSGGYPRALPFENGDLPGIFFGRAVSQMVRCHQVMPGQKFAIVGHGPELEPLATLLETAGAEVVVVAAADRLPKHPRGVEAVPVRAQGINHVKGLELLKKGDESFEVECDAVAVCVPPSPGAELATQLGAKVEWDDAQQTFKVITHETGQTAVPSVWAAGEITGAMNAQQAWNSGVRLAQSLLRTRP